MFKKGTDLQIAEQYDGALEQFRELVKAYPDSTQAPEAYYALGTIYHDRKNDPYKALENYRALVTKYPDHATSSNAAFLIGFIYNNDLKNIDSAKIAYSDFLQKYPNSTLASSAQFELATMGKSPEEILKMQNQAAQNDKDADSD
jgi:TolA-binding protein